MTKQLWMQHICTWIHPQYITHIDILHTQLNTHKHNILYTLLRNLLDRTNWEPLRCSKYYLCPQEKIHPLLEYPWTGTQWACYLHLPSSIAFVNLLQIQQICMVWLSATNTFSELMQSVMPGDFNLEHLETDDVGTESWQALPPTTTNTN